MKSWSYDNALIIDYVGGQSRVPPSFREDGRVPDKVQKVLEFLNRRDSGLFTV